jgi:hypothetical protein
MEIDKFEDAITIATTKNLSLHDLLCEYWEDSKITSVRGHPAEDFRGRKPTGMNPKNREYVDTLFSELKKAKEK